MCGKPIIYPGAAPKDRTGNTQIPAQSRIILDEKAEIFYKKRGHTSCESSASIADDCAGVTSAEKAADQTAMAFYKFIWNTERKPCQDFKQHLAA